MYETGDNEEIRIIKQAGIAMLCVHLGLGLAGLTLPGVHGYRDKNQQPIERRENQKQYHRLPMKNTKNTMLVNNDSYFRGYHGNK